MYVNFYHVKGGGPGVNLLRLLRIFRVFRVVKKLRSMQRILGAITDDACALGFTLVLYISECVCYFEREPV